MLPYAEGKLLSRCMFYKPWLICLFSDTPCFPILLIHFCKWRWCMEEIWAVVLNGSSIVQNWTIIHMSWVFLNFFREVLISFHFSKGFLHFSWQVGICNLTVCLVKNWRFCWTFTPLITRSDLHTKLSQCHSLRTSFKRN